MCTYSVVAALHGGFHVVRTSDDGTMSVSPPFTTFLAAGTFADELSR